MPVCLPVFNPPVQPHYFLFGYGLYPPTYAVTYWHLDSGFSLGFELWSC